MATYTKTCEACKGTRQVTACPTCQGFGFVPLSLCCLKCKVVHQTQGGLYSYDCSSKIYHSLSAWLKRQAKATQKKEVQPLSDTITEDSFWTFVATKVKELRLSRGWSQEDLAKELGYSRTTLINVEKGRQKPPAYVLFHVAYLLDVPFATLFPSLEIEK